MKLISKFDGVFILKILKCTVIITFRLFLYGHIKQRKPRVVLFFFIEVTF